MDAIYTFAGFHLDAVERLLIDGEGAIALPPKVFDTLLMLVSNAGHVLSKEKMLAEIWDDSFVEENNLAQNISQLRRMLGETAGAKFIETVPKYGYRFAAEVSLMDAGETRTEVTETTRARIYIDDGSLEEKRRGREEERRRKGDEASFALADWRREWEEDEPGAENIAKGKLDGTIPDLKLLPAKQSVSKYSGRNLLLAGLGIFIVVCGVSYASYRALNSKGASTQPRALAVLPFRNLRPDAETDFLGLALADATINKLDPVRTLTVRPSSYVAKYRNQEVDPRQVADALKVDTLLTGTFLKDGDDLRITVQLIDVNANKTISQGEMDVKYDNLLKVQGRVAQQVIDGLQLNLSPAETERLQSGPTTNPLAYENYLRGRFLISSSNHASAIRLLEKSVEIDPNNAIAWAYLGKAYSVSASQYAGGQEYMDKARAAYQRALALNPDEIETNVLLANFLTENNRLEESIPLLRGVVAANPNSPFAHWELSYAYRYAGMLDGSISEGEKAISLYPNMTGHLFNSYLYAGQYDKFIQSLPLTEDSYVMFYRGLGYYYLKDSERAAAALDRAYDLDPSIITSQIGKALRLGLVGQNRDGIKLLKGAEIKTAVSDGELVYKLAQAYAVLDDKPSALRALRRSIESGFVCYPYFINDPLMDNLRGESDYAALMGTALTKHNELRARFF